MSPQHSSTVRFLLKGMGPLRRVGKGEPVAHTEPVVEVAPSGTRYEVRTFRLISQASTSLVKEVHLLMEGSDVLGVFEDLDYARENQLYGQLGTAGHGRLRPTRIRLGDRFTRWWQRYCASCESWQSFPLRPENCHTCPSCGTSMRCIPGRCSEQGRGWNPV